MAVEFDLEGTMLYLNIRGWKPSNNDNWDYNWCKVAMEVKNKFMDYYIDSECMLSCEVESLIEALRACICGEEVQDITCIEPDFEFIFHAEGSGLKESQQMDFVINFWDKGVLTANSLHLCLDKADMQKLHDYLITVINEL